MSVYHQGERISDHYKFEEEVGRGANGIVKKAIHREKGDRVAVKIINKGELDDEE